MIKKKKFEVLYVQFHLKFDERYKHIPILLLTQKSLESVQMMFNSSGADKIMSKPFRFRDLTEKIQELLS